jgi:hypothetical protein
VVAAWSQITRRGWGAARAGLLDWGCLYWHAAKEDSMADLIVIGYPDQTIAMAALGARLGALMGKVTKSGIDMDLQDALHGGSGA